MRIKLGVAQIALILFMVKGLSSFAISESLPFFNTQTDSAKNYNPEKLVRKTYRDSKKFYHRLVRDNNNYLKQLTKSEIKIQKKLCLKNDKLADHLFKFSLPDRLQMRKSINNKTAYNAQLDTLKMLLLFLKQQTSISDTVKWNKAELYTAKAEKELSRYENTKQYLRTRKIELKSATSKFPELEKEMGAFDKANYYYTAQTEEYKKLLKEDGLNNLKDYQKLLKDKDFADFTLNESQITKTFGDFKKIKPDVSLDPMSALGKQSIDITTPDLSKLQTTKDVQAAMTQSLKDLGKDAITQFESKMDVMHTQMDKLKGFSSIGGYNISNAADIPDFTPNPLKTKLFKDRFTKGFSLQFLPGSSILPNGVNISAEAGYKIRIRWIAGIAISTDCRFQHWLPDLDKAKLSAFTEYALTRTWWLYGEYSKELKVFAVKNEATKYKSSLSEIKDYHFVTAIKFKPSYGKKFSYFFLLGYDWANESDFEKGIIYRVGFNF